MRTPLVPCVAALAVAATVQPFRPIVVSGDSMSPTYHSGQILIGDSRVTEIHRGDVVIFRHDGQTFVKRVAMIEGDRVERYRMIGMDNLIATSRLALQAFRRRGQRRTDLRVPAGTVYVLGDNFSESVDSRSYGPIPTRDILAVVDGAREQFDDVYFGVHASPLRLASR